MTGSALSELTTKRRRSLDTDYLFEEKLRINYLSMLLIWGARRWLELYQDDETKLSAYFFALHFT